MDVFGNVVEPPPIEYPELTLCDEIEFKEGVISAKVSVSSICEEFCDYLLQI